MVRYETGKKILGSSQYSKLSSDLHALTLAPPPAYTHGHIYMHSPTHHIFTQINMKLELEVSDWGSRVRRQLLKQADLCVISNKEECSGVTSL